MTFVFYYIIIDEITLIFIKFEMYLHIWLKIYFLIKYAHIWGLFEIFWTMHIWWNYIFLSNMKYYFSYLIKKVIMILIKYESWLMTLFIFDEMKKDFNQIWIVIDKIRNIVHWCIFDKNVFFQVLYLIKLYFIKNYIW